MGSGGGVIWYQARKFISDHSTVLFVAAVSVQPGSDFSYNYTTRVLHGSHETSCTTDSAHMLRSPLYIRLLGVEHRDFEMG